MAETDTDIVQYMNEHLDGWSKAMGLRFLSADAEAVEVEWTADEQHLQPYGIVHGGVHAGVVETVCSMGAALAAASRGHQGEVVGLENHTSFIRAVRAGTRLRARATPISRGRTTHVWKAEIHDDGGRLVAEGTVRLLCVELS